MSAPLVVPALNRRVLLQALAGILLCALGFFLARRESYDVHTVLATAGGCDMPTDIYEARSGTPAGAVVLFHGLSANKKVMAFTAEEFASQDLRVFVPDLPGHGKAPGPFSPQRVEFCAAALVRDLAARKAIIPERTILAGHSMGGAIATRVAAHVTVGGVIAISPAPMHPAPGVAAELLLFPSPPVLAAHSLVLSAAWEPTAIRKIAEDLVTQSSCTPVKYETIPRTSHVSVLFSSATFAAIRSWTSQILSIDPAAPLPKNMPALGCVLGLLGLSLLAPPFLRETGASQSVSLPPVAKTTSSFLTSALTLAILASLAVVFLHFFVPFRFLRIFQGGYFASFLFIVGLAVLLLHRKSIPPLKSFLTIDTVASAAAAIVLVLLFGAWLELTFYEAWLTAARWLRFPLLVLILIPWHLAEELLLGSPAVSPRFRRFLYFLLFRAILWTILVAAIFYLHSAQFVFVLLIAYFALFSILQRLATDVIRDRTRSIPAAAIFGAILFAAFALAILPVA
ncbi:MAG TPA: alpha/beta fold hydrolase [Candidatus Acidoferrum sp.]